MGSLPSLREGLSGGEWEQPQALGGTVGEKGTRGPAVGHQP